jgi:hypothetical protein
MGGMKDLMREYERARFPPDRQLDVHGEGPRAARDRAMLWIQSRAHEAPGDELLLIVDRVRRPGRPPGAVAVAVGKLLDELTGRLIVWWQPFTPGTLALRIADEPRMVARTAPRPPPSGGEGRTAETAGVAWPSPRADIPPELLDRAIRAAEIRIEREGHSIRILDVVLREIWIETQALAMERRLSFEEALERMYDDELERARAE